MAKPTILPIWNTNDTNTAEPDSAHKADGWLSPGGVPEKPPYQYYNFWQRNVHQWLNEINIKGLLGYDNLTDYVADLSYTIGSDGNFYQCKINNGPGSAIVNPVGDLTGTWVDVINVIPITARGYIDGLILSNDLGDVAHDISMAPGICRDKTDTLPIQLTAAMVKQIDVNWVAGTGNGGFPSGLVLAVDTWYHFYIIMKADGTVDSGFDTSLTAANLLADATNYIYYRRVGSVLTDGSSNIIKFIQAGDVFYWDAPPLEFSGAGTIAQILHTISVPSGVIVTANLRLYVASDQAMHVSTPDATDIAASTVASPGVVQYAGGAVNVTTMNQSHSLTDNQSRIAVRCLNVATIRMITQGWIDQRGKDA